MFIWAQYEGLQGARGLRAVVYGPGDRRIGLDHDAAIRNHRSFIAAQQPAEMLSLACGAANAGYAPAAYAEAARHLYGLWGGPPDPGQAYLWARLAAFAGHPRADLLVVQSGALLTPARRAELDAAFAHWAPLPCPEPARPAAPATSRTASATGRPRRREPARRAC